jgi:hypothetical protein
MIVRLRMAAVVGCLVPLIACERHVHTEMEMKWACKPDRDYDGLQWVEFHFVENSNYFDTEVGPHLCDALKSLGRQTVTMKFDLLGDFVSGYRGYSSVGIDGLATPFSDRNAGVQSFGYCGAGCKSIENRLRPLGAQMISCRSPETGAASGQPAFSPATKDTWLNSVTL